VGEITDGQFPVDSQFCPHPICISEDLVLRRSQKMNHEVRHWARIAFCFARLFLFRDGRWGSAEFVRRESSGFCSARLYWVLFRDGTRYSTVCISEDLVLRRSQKMNHEVRHWARIAFCSARLFLFRDGRWGSPRVCSARIEWVLFSEIVLSFFVPRDWLEFCSARLHWLLLSMLPWPLARVVQVRTPGYRQPDSYPIISVCVQSLDT